MDFDNVDGKPTSRSVFPAKAGIQARADTLRSTHDRLRSAPTEKNLDARVRGHDELLYA